MITILFLLFGGYCIELLDNIPLSFKMNGQVTYTPSSSGTAPTPGYKLSIIYDKHSWVGIKFITATKSSNYDVLIIQRQTQTKSGYYKCTLKQYYSPIELQNKLSLDSHNSLDLQAISYSPSNSYSLQIYRTTADTQGQDWQGGQFVEICFFTSDDKFNPDDWSAQYQSCYGYDVKNYVSNLVGRKITNMQFQGYSSVLYGGIDGPYPKMKLFWYFDTSLNIDNKYNLYVKIGGIINDIVGYDYQKCYGSNIGDYYGLTIDTLKWDLNYSGYNDGNCLLQVNSISTKLILQKLIYTYDQFDQVISKNINICIIGNQQSCKIIQLQNIYPIMRIESAVIVWQEHIIPLFISITTILLLMY